VNVRVAATAALALGLLGCSAGPQDAAPVPPPTLRPAGEVGLQGRLVQYRRDAARRYLQVKATATGQPLQVLDVALRPTGFAPLGPTPVQADLQPGGPVDLPAPYGEVRCEQDAGGVSTALVTVRVAGGPPQTVELELPDEGLVPRLHTAQCAEAEVRRQVDIALVDGWHPAGRALRATLRLQRREGQADVRVTELGDNTLFSLRTSQQRGPAPSPVVALAPGSEVAEVPFLVEATRCDPHALAESKRTTAFRVFVSVDGAGPLLLVVEPDAAGKATLVQFATDSCRGRG